jgi:hypothetical protein
MNTLIEITIDNETYLANVEYFYYTEEETETGQEECIIESIKFDNNIATQHGYPIQIGKDCNDLIQKLYPEIYEDILDSCLRDYKHKRSMYWIFAERD